MHQYPDINVQLNLINRRVDLIEEGFDLLILIGKLDDSRLIAKRLGSISRKIYVSPDYLKQQGSIKSIKQLSQCDFLLMGSVHSGGGCLIQSGEKQQEILVNPKLLVDDFLILKQMVIEGLGVAIIPDYMCQKDLANGTLIQVLPTWPMPNVDIFALYP